MDFSKRQLEIIDASLDIIAVDGIQGLTIKNIAKAVSISEPAIYRHFKDKMEILVSILQYFRYEHQTFVKNLDMNNGSVLEKLHGFFIERLRFFEKRPSFAVTVFSEEVFTNEEKLRSEVVFTMELVSGDMKELLKMGQDQNIFRKDIAVDSLIFVIMGSIRLLVKKWSLSNYEFSLVDEGSRILKDISKMIIISDIKNL